MNGTNKAIFAFPGNPISTYVNCLAYFYPWFAKSAGFTLKEETVILAENVVFKPHLTYFLQVRVEVKYGQLLAILSKEMDLEILQVSPWQTGLFNLRRHKQHLKRSNLSTTEVSIFLGIRF